MAARSVFERLEASGFRELKVHLTEEARAHAFAAAIPAQFTACVGYGRGERSGGCTSRPPSHRAAGDRFGAPEGGMSEAGCVI